MTLCDNIVDFSEEDRALAQLAMEGSYLILEELVESNSELVSRIDPLGRTLLHWACQWNNYENALVLTRHGADVNKVDCEGHTPLHLACSDGSFGIVALLLQNHANISVRDQRGFTPFLVTAAHAKRFQKNILECLLLAGADINETANNLPALYYATIVQASPSIKFLLSKGAEISQTTDGSGKSILDYAKEFDLLYLFEPYLPETTV